MSETQETVQEPTSIANAGEPSSPADFFHSLSPEAKDHILALLLKELIEINGGEGLIPLDLPGEPLGYYVPPKAANELYQQYRATLPDDAHERLERTIATESDLQAAIPSEAAWKWIRAQTAANG